MLTKVKINPVRIFVPKNCNALELLMVWSNESRGFIVESVNTKEYFEIELSCSKHVAIHISKNINLDLKKSN